MTIRKYTDEFKLQAVELAKTLKSVSEASRQLDVPDVNIRKWIKKLSKKPSTIILEDEITRLRRENAELKKVNHILKSAAAFFSQDHLK